MKNGQFASGIDSHWETPSWEAGSGGAPHFYAEATGTWRPLLVK